MLGHITAEAKITTARIYPTRVSSITWGVLRLRTSLYRGVRNEVRPKTHVWKVPFLHYSVPLLPRRGAAGAHAHIFAAVGLWRPIIIKSKNPTHVQATRLCPRMLLPNVSGLSHVGPPVRTRMQILRHACRECAVAAHVHICTMSEPSSTITGTI